MREGRSPDIENATLSDFLHEISVEDKANMAQFVHGKYRTPWKDPRRASEHLTKVIQFILFSILYIR